MKKQDKMLLWTIGIILAIILYFNQTQSQIAVTLPAVKLIFTTLGPWIVGGLIFTYLIFSNPKAIKWIVIGGIALGVFLYGGDTIFNPWIFGIAIVLIAIFFLNKK